MHRVRPYAGPLGKPVPGIFENCCQLEMSIRKRNRETQEESAVFGWFFLRFCCHVPGKNGQRQVNSGAVKKMNIDGYILENLCTHLSELGSGKVYTR